jgi:localization factor PodJL
MRAAQAEPQPRAKPAQRRQPIDPNLPPDYPLEPGSGVPRVQPLASTAERIAASEAALGAAKPGGANHPGQTNFIAAARRAAQAAAAAAPEASPAPSIHAAGETKSISQRVKSLIVGASVVLLVFAGGRIVLQMFESEPPVAETAAPSSALSPETPAAEPAPAPASRAAAAPAPEAPVLPQPPATDSFNAAPSGVMLPERKARPAASPADAELDATGSIGKRGGVQTPVRQAAREPVPPLPDKLPATLRNAALKGDAAADYEIGIRLIEGRSVAQNTEEGLRWLERAARAGIAPAHFRIGGIYEKGLGVKKDLMLARSHYVAAADRGNSKAMHNLAVLYAEGLEGKPDYRTAAGWFRRAAEYGVADSQYNLGILYARGIGIEQNLAESYKWFALAALQGDRDAAKKRDDVAAKLDAIGLTAARSAVQSFSAQQQPDEAVTVVAPPGGWDRPAVESAPAKKLRTGARVTAS